MVIGNRDSTGNIQDFFADDSRDPDTQADLFRPLGHHRARTNRAMCCACRTARCSITGRTSGFSQISFNSYDLALDNLTSASSSDDPQAQTTSLELIANALATGELDGNSVKSLLKRTGEGMRVIAMCLLVVALAAFPSGKRRRFEIPVELVVLGASFIERGFSSYLPGPGPLGAWSGSFIMIGAATADPRLAIAGLPAGFSREDRLMSRIDWIVLRRIGGRVALTVIVFFGLLALVESLDTWRFKTLSGIGGPPLAILAIVSNALRSIVGHAAGDRLDRHDHRRAGPAVPARNDGDQDHRCVDLADDAGPLLGALFLGLFAAFLADSVAITINRTLPAASKRSTSGELWLKQQGHDGAYIIGAAHAGANGTKLDDVTVYMTDADQRDRINAASARLVAGAWVLNDAVRYRPDAAAEILRANSASRPPPRPAICASG